MGIIRRLQRLISIRNLWARGTRPVGQVATFMLLVIAGGLTFTLAMASLGQVVSRTTTMDSAADQAALDLAGKLANKSNALWVALGHHTSICRGTGFLGLIIIIVIVIIAIIVTIVTLGAGSGIWVGVGAMLSALATPIGAGTAVVAGAAIGAAGGAIGGAVDGSGAAAGALHGAMIGAAIGAGAGAGAYLGPVLSAVGIGVGQGAGFSGGVINAIAAALPAGTSAFIPSAATVIGAIGATVLSVASTAYNTYVANQLTADAFRALALSTQGLGERRTIRESTFLHVLTRVVDDPNMTVDPISHKGGCHWPDNTNSVAKQIGDHGSAMTHDPLDDDLDGDGNLAEPIPCFMVWWNQRMKALKQGPLGKVPLPERIKQFIKGAPGNDTPLEVFRCQVRRKYTWSLLVDNDDVDKDGCVTGQQRPASQCGPGSPYPRCWGFMTRADVEGNPAYCSSPGHCPGPNGRMIKVLDALAKASQVNLHPSFYTPGPTGAELADWNLRIASCETDGCTSQQLPPGFDEVDQLIWELQEFVSVADFLRDENADFLATAIDTWLPWFYDPNSTSDFYDMIYDRVDPSTGKQLGWYRLLDKWENELKVIRSRFPTCTWSGTLVTNPPCTFVKDGKRFYTVDANPSGDFSKLFDQIGRFKTRIVRFRTAISNFATSIQGLEQDLANNWGGGGRKVFYTWEDSRGVHWVEVRISRYLIAHISNKSGFLQNCVKLQDYQDTTGQHTWVRVSRSDPPTPFGRLFTFNETRSADLDLNDPDPADDGLGYPVGAMSKKSKAVYGIQDGAPPGQEWYVRLKRRQPIR